MPLARDDACPDVSPSHPPLHCLRAGFCLLFLLLLSLVFYFLIFALFFRRLLKQTCNIWLPRCRCCISEIRGGLIKMQSAQEAVSVACKCVCVSVCVVAVCHRKRLLTIRRSCSKPPSKLCAAFVSNTRPSRHPLLSFTVPPSVRQTIVVVVAVIVGSYQLPVASCKSVAKTDACHCTKLATGLESHQQLLKESQMLLTCCCCCCCCCRCCCE